MAGEIATAYVSLVASSAKLGSSIQGKLDAAAVSAGKSSGSKLGSSLISSSVKSLDRAGGKILSSVGTVLKTGMLGVGAAAGASLWGGLNRVLDTEDATKMFKQLGLGASEVEELMGDLRKEFETGPFAYPDVYNISSQLMASNVAMEDLTSTTAAIGNMAAFAGKDLSEIGPIMTSIAGQGKVSAAELNRMGQMGIPIRQLLAKALGVSGEELSKMVSSGDLTSDMFFKLIGEIDEFDGAMESFADSSRGAWSIMKAGLAGVGEALLSPWFGEDGDFVQFMKTVNGWIFDHIQPNMANWSETIKSRLIPILENLGDWVKGTFIPVVKDMVKWVSDNRDELLKIAKAVAPVIAGLGAMAVGVNLVSKAMKATPLGIVISLASALVYAYQNSEEFRKIVNNAFESVRSVIQPVVDSVIGWITNLADMFSGGGPVGGAAGDLQVKLGSIFESIKDIIAGFVDAASILFDVLSAAWDRFGGVIINQAKAAWEYVTTIVDAALKVISGIIDTVLGIITLDWDRMREGVGKIVEGLKDAVVGAFKYLGNTIKNIVEAARQAVSGAFNTIKNRIQELIGVAVEWVANKFTSMVTTVSGLPGRVASAASGLFKSFHTAIDNAKDWVRNRIRDIVGFVTGIPGRIRYTLNAVADMIAAPFKTAGTIIKNLWNSTVGGFGVTVPDIPGLPGRGERFEIPRMHTGGVVPGRPGQEVLTILMAGETVLPTHRSDYRKNSGGMNFYGPVTFGDTGVVSDLDFWTRSNMAGV